MEIEVETADDPKVFPIKILLEDDDIEVCLYANGNIETTGGSIDNLEAALENMESFYYATNEESMFAWLVLQIHKLRQEIKELKSGKSSKSD